jgi:UDP-N-acetylglucosamine 2-epimerase (non-hydrolysing)
VVGARPNFMKAAPIAHELTRRGIEHVIVHTGQHYDAAMSDEFFRDLDLPRPAVNLEIGSDTHSRQTARIMIALEEVSERERFDLMIVVGDVNSTLAATLVAAKSQISVAHVEAGLRSFDSAMPEEINRIIVDHTAQLLFTTEPSGNQNLRNEGIPKERIHFAGNCMIDSLKKHLPKALDEKPWAAFGFAPKSYGLLTLHRPSNVDGVGRFQALAESINEISQRIPILFPLHPRTRQRLAASGIQFADSVHICSPLSYIKFLGVMAEAKFVLTDSGGIQEETTALGVPCLTLRDNTERPVTITEGTNRLVGEDPQAIRESVELILNGGWPRGKQPRLWDGNAAVRVVNSLEEYLDARNENALAIARATTA